MTDTSRFPPGSTLTPDSLSFDPSPRYSLFLDRESVTWTPEVNLWSVHWRADVVAVLDNAEAFTARSPHSLPDDPFGTTMISAEGDLHRRMRNPFAGVYVPRAVRASSSAFIEQEANELIDRFIVDKKTDLVKSFSDPMALYAVKVSLGVPIVDFAQLRHWYNDFAAALSNFRHDFAVRERGQRTTQEFGIQLAEHIARSRTQPDESLLSHLVHAPNTDLSERAIIFVIILGGLETTTAMFSNTVWALLNHPDQFDEVKRDPAKLMKSAVEETLRWESPVQTATRHVTQPITVQGVDFALGDTVQRMLGAANRDADSFTDPGRFDIHRVNASHHPAFARGRHHCLGASQACLEGEIGLRVLFE
jgi:cytochrome P450